MSETTPSVPSTPTGDQTPATNPVADQFTDDQFNQVFSRYKQDPKELAKAKWEQDKTITRLTQELANLRKAGASSVVQTAPTDPSPADSTRAESQPQGTQATADAPGEETPPEPVSASELFSAAYLEAFEKGQVSEDTKAAFVKQGFHEADAQLLLESMGKIVEQRVKEAQRYVETDVRQLKQWAEQAGNLTDQELSVIQEALNLGNYSILKDVERKYKASLKTVVQHGSIGSSGSDVYDGPESYYKDRRDSRYGWDKDYTSAVDAKFNRSNTGDWQRRMLGM